MADTQPLVVAIEDLSTVGAVAGAAARLALQQRTPTLVLVHVIEEHAVLNGILTTSFSPVDPILEPVSEAQECLDLAEQIIAAEFQAQGQSAPVVRKELGRGSPSRVLALACEAYQATGVVLGARRPHLFGRMTHPDVRRQFAALSSCLVHLAPLQEGTQPAGR
jgi:nucleotide-binding universal stress UspA family protein